MPALLAQLLGAWHACTGYPKVENSGHRSRAIESDLARANQIGTVPIAYARARSLSIALEACVTDIRHPASCPLAAGQARAGWLAACMNSHSVSEFWIMHA